MGKLSSLDRDTLQFLSEPEPYLQVQAPAPTIAQSRANINDLFNKHAPESKTVARHQRHQLSNGCGEFPIDIFWPPTNSHKQALPLVIYLHGGGWFQGDLECYENLVRNLCVEAGIVVINVGYHLAPEHKFPCGLTDGYAALEWAIKQQQQLNIDPQRIAIMGDSAGGNLTAALAVMNQQKQNYRLAAQFLLYPVLDVTPESNYPSRDQYGQGDFLLRTDQIHWTREQYLNDQSQASNPLVSPLLHNDLSSLPKTYIMTAECDPLRDEGKAYSEKLKAAGVECEYCCMEGTIHGFLSLAGSISAGRNGISILAEKLKEYLKVQHLN